MFNGGKLGPITPYHTTDRYLDLVLRDTAGSEHVIQALATLPEKEPIAVVYRVDGTTDTLLAYIVTYFAWPRPVKSIAIDNHNVASQMQTLHDAQITAAFFCGLNPPPGVEPLVQIGKGLAMAPRRPQGASIP